MRILVFGDSIAYGAWDEGGGWVQRLRKFLDEKINLPDKDLCLVYNLGVSGDTTKDLLERIENEMKSRRIQSDAIVIFSIGINDSCFCKSFNRNNIPLEEFQKNIEKLFVITGKYTEKIISLGLTPVDERKTCPIPWDTDKFYKNEYIQKYNEIIKNACNKYGVRFIDLFDEWRRIDYKNLLHDGLHPNSNGHKKIFETVKNFLIENEYLKI
ncbi:MAG: hypothetical protein GXO63_02460 [Candidatus Micrarchaeota archaeon]|nr:hypothetical protein [Candidatus Micrarchaeota archaeon]